MQIFEFIMVLVAMVVGLGIAELLGTIARVLRKEVDAGPLHAIWLLHALFSLVQGFWAAWAYQGRSDWSFADLSVFLLPRLALFVVAAVLNPPPGASGSLDDYLVSMRRRFFAAQGCFLLSASTAYVLLSDGPGPPDVVRGALLLLYVFLASTENRRVQMAGAVVAFAATLAFTYSFSFSLSGMFGMG